MRTHFVCFLIRTFGSLISDPITEKIEEIWNDDEHDILIEQIDPLTAPIPLPNTPADSSEKSIGSLISWLTGFLMLLQAQHSVSDAVINAILKFKCFSA